jgi:filamentous hemagglutinin family protein
LGRTPRSPYPIASLSTALGIFATLAASLTLHAGDILRGGGSFNTKPGNASGGMTSAATEQARANAADALARTTQAVQAVKAMQDAARKMAISGPNNLGVNPNQPGAQLPTVPNGLVLGGLQVAPGVAQNPKLWQGARLPTETTLPGQTIVSVVQTDPQAILNWETFNIGKSTTLNFNQSGGGDNKTQWIAFNKVDDPSGAPSQILGSIKAPGQVYVMNPNGIIFGGSSQVNAHALVASSLPINDGLITRGLLNNPDFQFLFSALPLEAGANGTPAFDPPKPHTPAFRTGDVVVREGAVLSSPTTPERVGGRIALIGANVKNAGTISTPDGQTILAAGLQVGVAAHATSDPTLRGLDVFVGAVADPKADPKTEPYAGTATNTGLIDAPRANVTMIGRKLDQLGAIDSSTSVTLNGRIDLLADYNTIRATTADGKLAFSPTASGTVTLGPGSVTQILPELESTETVVGTQLALTSQVNVEGLAIHFAGNSQLLAPNADVTVNAGTWLPDPGNGIYLLTYSQGQIYLDPGAMLNVAGTPGVTAPISETILAVELRGAELADSPLQRFGLFRGKTINVDMRQSGIFNGRPWVGTPLADASGYVGLVKRSVGELTTAGGTVKMNAGNSVIMQPGSRVDVSGGWIEYQGGIVETTRIVSGSQILDISQATPDRVYDGFYTGTFTHEDVKWGFSETFTNPLSLSGAHFEQGYNYGASGGTIAITAPSVALDGDLLGSTIAGPRQRTVAPVSSTLALTFKAQDPHPRPRLPIYAPYSPTPPSIVFQPGVHSTPASSFALDASGNPTPLRADRRDLVVLSPELLGENGFGNLVIDNSDGRITLPAGITLATRAGGSITLSGANVDIEGQVTAPGGSVSISVFGTSPFLAAKLAQDASAGGTVETPAVDPARGHFRLGAAASLSTAGLIVDDRISSPTAGTLPLATNGGSITITSFDAELETGSVIDVSGGVAVSAAGKRSYGAGGSIVIKAGQDPNVASLLGGELSLDATLKGFSGAKGGALSILAPLIQIGGATSNPDTLLLSPEFFSQGGFGSFTLTGLGAATRTPHEYLPAIEIAAETIIDPVAESWLAMPYSPGSSALVLTPMLLPQALRTPVSLAFNAVGVRDSFKPGVLLARGDFVMGAGAAIRTDPGASVSINGDTVEVLGSIIAPGGSIAITGGKDSTVLDFASSKEALPTVHLGPRSLLSVAGTMVLTPDPFGHRTGYVLPGGSISVSGNIVAQSGAILDASGASGILDLPPAIAALYASPTAPLAGMQVPEVNSGVNAPLYASLVVPTRVDSDGGSIVLKGQQELFTDATLIGKAGGPNALGGSLAISSGRFYPVGSSSPTPLDITLLVTQGGLTIPRASRGVGIGQAVLDRAGVALPGFGYFAANQFTIGGFDSLSLGGTVQFSGPISIAANRELTVASGGVLFADSSVNLRAPHVALGTPFLTPLTPAEQSAPFLVGGQPFHFPPTFGPGSLTVTARLIEIGNLSLQNIGSAHFIADGGDIRGDGTLDVAGEIYLRAGQIYAPTALSFTIAASDFDAGNGTQHGSVTIASSGERQVPLSLAGQLNIYGSIINQGGVLRAPGGTINLGWDGTGTGPTDPISGATVAITQQLKLAPGSITSVSAIDPATGDALLIPYGINLNGTSWIDPTGTDITLTGVPGKAINLGAVNLIDATGSLIDIRGGGEAYAYRWVPGNGGSKDVLASSSSFAIVPGYQADFAPYAPFSNSTNALNLGGDPGFMNKSLSAGDRIYLGATEGLPAGYYTLLPARYALLQGAFLVTPRSGTPIGTLAMPDGSTLVPGYRFNDLSTSRSLHPLTAWFEVDPGSVVRSRSQYDDFFANTFLANAATAPETPRGTLPLDAGHLILKAAQSMTLLGSIAAQAPHFGRGGWIDISSPADIVIGGDGGSSGQAGVIFLSASKLSSFGAESLLVGGFRQRGENGTIVTVTTGNLTVDNAGTPLTGPEIILVANHTLTLAAGAQIEQAGLLSGHGDTLLLGDAAVPGSGDGALLRVTGDLSARIVRAGLSSLTNPTLQVGAGVRISAASLTLDSTSTLTLDPTASLEAQAIALGSGRISLVLDNAPGLQPGAGLVLTGPLLQSLQTSDVLSLSSYSSIDIYGTGEVGVAGTLALHTPAIRGFNNGGTVTLSASGILLDNGPGRAGPKKLPGLNGTLVFEAGKIRLGANQIEIDSFADVALNASGGIILQGAGGFTAQGNVTATTPFIAAAKGASQSIAAAGALTIQSLSGKSGGPAAAGLGAALTLLGSSVDVSSAIVLPSGTLTLHATNGDVTVSSRLDVGGTSRSFYDLVRYTDAGEIRLMSEGGSVTLAAGSAVNVAAQTGGGNAGSLFVSTPDGAFTLAAKTMLGQAGAGGLGGTFSLDAGVLPSMAALDAALNEGGFVQSRTVRVRIGDVTVDGLATSHSYYLSADQGSITVSATGKIDASGADGGTISLAAHGSVTLLSGAELTVAGENFNAAGKGGAVSLEAGSETNGTFDASAAVDIRAGSSIDLSVASNTAASAAAGHFTGTLHLRAPQTAGNTDLQINPIDGTIHNASSVVVEGYQIFDTTASGGSIDAQKAAVFANGQAFAGNTFTISSRLLANNAGLASVLHVRPGAEIINTTGGLTLASNWDLSTYRFGPGNNEPGVLTLRAAGDLTFNFKASLSDGFGGASSFGLWDAPLLAPGSQSWSYRLVAGADLGAADFRQVLAIDPLDPTKGALLLGKNSPALPITSTGLRQSTIPNFYQVIRTGTGDIDIWARGDVQLLNPLATIYTAGTQAAAMADFDLPNLDYRNDKIGPTQGPIYPAQYSLAGGNVTISAQNDIAHYLLQGFGAAAKLVPDSTRELPNNWLYRRGWLDPATGQFGVSHPGTNEVASTSWWIDYSNFFEGVGALGGGNITMIAGRDIKNVDAVIPTNARLPKGAPDASKLLELGGGDLVVRAGRDLDGGVYYVERGKGVLNAGASIHTNSTRAALTQGDITNLQIRGIVPDPVTWLPTTLFAGKSSFDVTARGDLILGPVANPFLLPQGINNSFYEKSYFSTYATTDVITISSLGGTITLKDSATGGAGSLSDWFQKVLLFDSFKQSFASRSQPWLRLVEGDITPFATVAALMPGTLRVTAFSGDINTVGRLILSPSPQGTIDLFASGSINGVQVNGLDDPTQLVSLSNPRRWGSSTINLSDANPLNIPGVASPISFQAPTTGFNGASWAITPANILDAANILFNESGATEGAFAVVETKQALHAPGPLHADDPDPVHLYAQGGNISGLTLFSGKQSRIIAGRDLSDIGLYLQNVAETDVSLVAAGRDIIAYSPNSPLRLLAQTPGNVLIPTVGKLAASANSGDIQISGPGTLELLAGRNLDLGVGPNESDGTAVGVTSIGKARNPFLPFDGAAIIAGAGIGSSAGLTNSQLDFPSFIEEFLGSGSDAQRLLSELDPTNGSSEPFDLLPPEQQDLLALQVFYRVLRDAGRNHGDPSSDGFGNFDAGFKAIDNLFPGDQWRGDISLTSRQIKTASGGNISLFAPGGKLTVGFDIAGNQPVDQGILTEAGGKISIFTHNSVVVGTSRIFTLRGGDEVIWSSVGDIAAGASSKTVQSAPPTRVLIDPQSADVKTDLAGLATGGGIGVLATVGGTPPGDVDLIAPAGTVDAGDAGIRVSGNLNISAVTVLNADNIQVSGTSVGVPPPVVVAAPNLAGLSAASSAAGSATVAASDQASAQRQDRSPQEELPSIITVEVIDDGGGEEN